MFLEQKVDSRKHALNLLWEDPEEMTRMGDMIYNDANEKRLTV